MNAAIESILVFLVLMDLVLLGASRLRNAIRIVAIQGVALGALPLLAPGHLAWPAVLLGLGSAGIKGFVFPALMNRAERFAGPRGDNLSVVTVRWEQSYVDEGSSISTHTMSQEDVTTRLDEFGRNPDYKSDLTDDEIERAIEEIRAAIDKYTPNT